MTRRIHRGRAKKSQATARRITPFDAASLQVLTDWGTMSYSQCVQNGCGLLGSMEKLTRLGLVENDQGARRITDRGAAALSAYRQRNPIE